MKNHNDHHTKCPTHFAACAVTALLLAACGGGGGGGSTASSGTPTNASSSTGNQSSTTAAPPIKWSASNAAEGAGVGAGIGIVALGFAQAAADWTNGFNPANGLTQPGVCGGGGSASLALTASNGNNRPGAGNQLVVTLNACYIKPEQDAFTGTLIINYQSPASGYQQSGIISFQPGFNDGQATTVTFTGQLAYDYNSDGVTQTLHAYSTSTPFGLTVSEGTNSKADSFTNMNSVRTISLATARTSTSLNFNSDSAILGGSYGVTTPVPLGSWFDAYPDVGTLAFTGAAGTDAALTVVNGDASALNVTVNNLVVGQVQVSDMQTYAFSGYGWITADATGQNFASQGATAQGFAVLQAPASTSVTPEPQALTWIFSRPLNTASLSGATYNLNLSSCPAKSWVANQISATASLSGATMTILPSAQIEEGCTYGIALTTTAVAPGINTVADVDNDILSVNISNVTVSPTVHAVIYYATAPILLGSSSNLLLDASQSYASGLTTPLVSWSQLSGPTINFSTTTGLTTNITSASTTNGTAVIQLTVTNADGGVDVQQISIPVLNDLTSATAIYYSDSSTASTVITNLGNTTTSVSDDNSSTILDTNFQVGGGQARLLFNVGTGQTIVNGETLTLPISGGAGAALVWLPPEGGTCTSPTGSVTIDAIGYNGDGTLQSLAMNFSISCNNQTYSGKVRFNSSLTFSS
jgi:hypothetical protein